ncbi:MAG: HDOD domain-containing protein, partial [Desulfovibrionaceae bacterium]|nr:HDOD domain-containing protein [Desulfovibrionaceae bacterium]
MKNPAETRQDILKAIKKVPVLSSSVSQVMDIISKDDHCLADLVNIIRFDSALTANILKTANSAFYGISTEVSSVDRAISLIGEDSVINITLKKGLAKLFDKELTGYKSASGELWRHDLRTAIASKKIAKLNKNHISSEIAFTGGLLHDIGKAVISSFLGETSSKIIEAIDKGRVKDFHEAEQRLLGMDHAMVGFELAKHWNLPEALTHIIRYHHIPSEAPSDLKPIVYCVHLGDILAMMAGCGTGADT